jgi:Secretion system C-terminal sorting domain
MLINNNNPNPKSMKKIYTIIFLSALTSLSFAQGSRKTSLTNMQIKECSSCIPNIHLGTNTTLCNFETDDTLALYYSDAVAPFDSGWAIGHNGYKDKGWVEKYRVSGSANVVGGAYLLYENSGVATSGGIALGKVYDTLGTAGKPGTVLGTANIPYSSMVLTGRAPTVFTFGSPISVNKSFFMAFELGVYTLGGPDTIGVFTTRLANRSTTNPDQNCALFSDGTWNFELTENFKFKNDYQLCAIVDLTAGVNNYVSKGDVNLYAAYPNPAGNEITVNYSLSNPSNTSIEVFDSQGKSMLKINRNKLSSGSHLEKINLSSFNSGTYFYNVKTENGTLFSRFSVVK